MATEAKPRRATYQDILKAPEHNVAEIVDGELYLSPRPAGPHTSVSSTLSAELLLPFGRGRGGPGGWIVLSEPELHLGEHVMVPDIAGWRRERLLTVDTAFFTVAPDWLCETLSPSTEKLDRARKLPRYAEAGVNHVWLVHPERRTLEVLRRQGAHWLTVAVHHDDQKVRAEPFDAIELDLAELWADLDKPLPTRASDVIARYGERAVEDAL